MNTLRILSKYCLWSIHVCLINLPIVDWKFGRYIGKNYWEFRIFFFFSMNLYLSWKLCQVLSHKLSFDD
uniref:NADH dehydrogenase subunit I n=1 Tax=Abies chensiensis TaxID=425836 RepID=A0A4D6EWP4_9CONI|nr:NADH dehydrogenase subunit I [Abies chensiensis]